VTTPDPTARFFAELAARDDEPLLRKATGATRFEIRDGKKTRQWVVRVDKGRIDVAAGRGDAQCVLRVDKAVFDKVVTGRLNGVAAVLRGDIAVEGDWRLLVRMQRLFPEPRRRRAAA
jgi:putative sterol carrier protein